MIENTQEPSDWNWESPPTHQVKAENFISQCNSEGPVAPVIKKEWDNSLPECVNNFKELSKSKLQNNLSLSDKLSESAAQMQEKSDLIDIRSANGSYLSISLEGGSRFDQEAYCQKLVDLISKNDGYLCLKTKNIQTKEVTEKYLKPSREIVLRIIDDISFVEYDDLDDEDSSSLYKKVTQATELRLPDGILPRSETENNQILSETIQIFFPSDSVTISEEGLLYKI